MIRSISIAARAAGLAALLVWAAEAPAESTEDDWKKVVEQEGVTVLTTQSTDGTPAFRARVTVNAPLCEVFAALRDTDGHPRWVDGCVEARILAEEDRNRFLTYNRTSAGRFKLFGVRDREAVLRSILRRNDRGDQIRIAFESVEVDIPDLRGSDAIRLSHLRGYYRLKRVAARRTAVEYQSNIDLAGSLPKFVTRYAIRTVPFRTLDGLRRHLDRGPASASSIELRKACQSWLAADPSTLR